MLVVGVTGGIGSGKTTVGNFFKELGVEVIDADLIAREIVQPGTEIFYKIIEHFGDKILANNELNRSLLREIIFQNPTEKKWLEDLLHPVIMRKIKDLIAKVKSPYCVVLIPLLIEIKSQRIFDRILVIDVAEELQIKRTMARNNINESQVKTIMASQATREQRLAYADDIIVNDKSLAELKNDVIALHKKYKERV